jgi:hypothetical protein
MPTDLKISATAVLPIVGTKTFSIPDPLTGIADSAAAEVLGLDGGSVTGKASASESTDGIELSIDIELGPLGEKTFTIDEKLTGLAKDAVDDVLALDGGEVALTLTVSEA